MKKHIKELVAKPRKTASGGKFQADLTPCGCIEQSADHQREGRARDRCCRGGRADMRPETRDLPG